MTTLDTAYWRCECGYEVSGEVVVDPTFLPRIEEHKAECVVALEEK